MIDFYLPITLKIFLALIITSSYSGNFEIYLMQANPSDFLFHLIDIVKKQLLINF
jgi:hypothetical protein